MVAALTPQFIADLVLNLLSFVIGAVICGWVASLMDKRLIAPFGVFGGIIGLVIKLSL